MCHKLPARAGTPAETGHLFVMHPRSPPPNTSPGLNRKLRDVYSYIRSHHPLPSDPAQSAFHNLSRWRESCATCGMALGSYTATRGWSPEVMAATTERLQADGLLAEKTLTAAG